jgi:hypothetical protein
MPPPAKGRYDFGASKTRALAPRTAAIAPSHVLSPNDIIEAKRLFIREYAKRANVGDACRVAGCSRKQFYAWRDLDPIFNQALGEAQENAHDLMEREAHRRAFEGTDLPAINKDGVVLHPITGKQVFIRQYSDFLADKLLRANRPDKFGNKLEVKHVDVGKASDGDIIQQLSKLGVALRPNTIDIDAKARDIEEVPQAAKSTVDQLEQNIYLMGQDFYEEVPPEGEPIIDDRLLHEDAPVDPDFLKPPPPPPPAREDEEIIW